MKKRALLTVSDKRAIAPFALSLQELGYEIVSTGGTADSLRKGGVERVLDVSEVTGFPEMLDGRVKILHPAIQAPILSEDTIKHNAVLDSYGWSRFEVVACNLYPFSQKIAEPGCTYAEANENIDIGGPTAIRAGCKGDRYVVVNYLYYETVVKALKDPLSASKGIAQMAHEITGSWIYAEIIEAKKDPSEILRYLRWLLKIAVFKHTAVYENAIYSYELNTMIASLQ